VGHGWALQSFKAHTTSSPPIAGTLGRFDNQWRSSLYLDRVPFFFILTEYPSLSLLNSLLNSLSLSLELSLSLLRRLKTAQTYELFHVSCNRFL
jgi:hypothetical protein